ncbi:RNA polymerase [Pseudomonas phage PPPL-1]|uniref:Uncharacterized protein n=1 Tax=Pseudomonas phage PPPL-1 TaxID=1755692 RepID=A0A0S2MVR6_9CAUD|nr:RNA polymerase [Pseudomonas phage PPPL-1]ALO79970.1 hypothetical protein PPPL1_010 [Pseudomonas phage PPPL-1]
MFARNFEKTTKTSARRSFEDIEQVRAKKGKRNKPARDGRKEWSEE